jgi:hypothetical protein
MGTLNVWFCCVEADAMVKWLYKRRENHAIEAFHKKKRRLKPCIQNHNVKIEREEV